jgi:hypothetical protein
MHFASRVGPDGSLLLQAILQITQEAQLPVDVDDKKQGQMPFEGGCTLVLNLKPPQQPNQPTIAYCIRKPVTSVTRLERQRNFFEQFTSTTLRATYFDESHSAEQREPFALLHRFGG